MIEKLLSSASMEVMQKGLDASALRQKVIANNLANVSTPGFKASEVSFEEELKIALAGGQTKDSLAGVRTHAKHIPIGDPAGLEAGPQVRELTGTTFRNDDNNVDIDREMAMLAKNSIVYNALAQKVAGDFAKLKYVISEGRR